MNKAIIAAAVAGLLSSAVWARAAGMESVRSSGDAAFSALAKPTFVADVPAPAARPVSQRRPVSSDDRINYLTRLQWNHFKALAQKVVDIHKWNIAQQRRQVMLQASAQNSLTGEMAVFNLSAAVETGEDGSVRIALLQLRMDNGPIFNIIQGVVQYEGAGADPRLASPIGQAQLRNCLDFWSMITPGDVAAGVHG
ncbi:MAG: hypothetical protein KGO96_11665 [Elusimicrobia bacterium]|nr:hypothetical protein [Elusimicrobiota bacterium]MDE2426551.1 hypothetical protein [Elusimicrobiota bacterium]